MRGTRKPWAALALGLAVSLSAAAPGRTQDAAEYSAARAAMIEVIRAHAREAASGVLAPRIAQPVLEAMARVPRHEFVPAPLRDLAYEDRPLPIGFGQTISQPYIVALMTDLLGLRPGARALEVGTGSGYQAAVLDALGVETYTIEIVPQLSEQAAARFARLGTGAVRARVGDGYYGWPEAAPFDGILVTAAAGHVPPPLVHQLKAGGRMVIPVGPPFMVQELVLVSKAEDGTVRTRQLLPVRFVPLTGEH